MQNKISLIGIVPLWDSEKDSFWMLPGYMDGIAREGALPVMLPLTSDEKLIADIVSRFDGFILSGGHDISPTFYDETVRETCGETCEGRDKMEWILTKYALAADKPILGICRGLQFLNVFLGGSLYQDIPTELTSDLRHSQKPPYDSPVHEVALTGFFHEMVGVETIEVNSYHHQGIKKLAEGLEPCGIAPDGLIEAVYMPDKSFVFAMQWHPEFALEWDSSKKIFAAFVRACEH